MEGELRRLRFGVGTEDASLRPFLVRVQFAAQDPARVIADARAVLARVVEQMDDWPMFERWPQLLPAWFVQRCAPEHVPGPERSFDTEAWLRRWRAMTPEQRAAVSQESWTLSGWLYYFDPTEEGMGEDRSWWWWDAGIDEASNGWVQVATTGWPFGSGSLSWLIEASGGVDLSYGA